MMFEDRSLTDLINSAESYEFSDDRNTLTLQCENAYHSSCDEFSITSKDVTDEMLKKLEADDEEEFYEAVYEFLLDQAEVYGCSYHLTYGEETYIEFGNDVYEEKTVEHSLYDETADEVTCFRTHPYSAVHNVIISLPADRKRGDLYSAEWLEKNSHIEVLCEEPGCGFDHHYFASDKAMSNLWSRFQQLTEE